MSESYAPCEVVLHFADGDYRFRLPLKRIAELQEKCGAGLGAIYSRVMIGEYYIADLTETIRLGLIGGGLDELKALRLCERYCEDWPKERLWQTAAAILGACVRGYRPKDQSGEGPEGNAEAAGPTDGSTSPQPSETVLSSV